MKNIAILCPLSGWAVPPVEWVGASKEAAEANAPPSNPRPSLPILPKGPISKILSLYQDHHFVSERDKFWLNKCMDCDC